MRSFFLLALFTLALSISCPTGQYDNAGVCTVCSCSANKYRTGGCSGTTNSICQACATCWSNTYMSGGCVGTTPTQCSSCAVCTSGRYKSAGCLGSTNTVCSNCSLCGANQYQRIACTPTTNRLCENCVTTSDCAANNQYARLYGICGGPSGTSTTTCMPPGQALCQVCPNEASLSADQGGLAIQCDGQQLDGSFWTASPGNVADCCAALLSSRDQFVPADGVTDDATIFTSRNAWLYDNLLTCTGIRTVYPLP